MNLEIVSRNLVRLRQTNNYTQDDLASKLNVSRQAISKWENGSSIPSIDTLLILSKLFGISINEILEPKRPFITHFEDLISLDEDIITDALSSRSPKTIVTALMIRSISLLYKDHT